MLSYFPTENPLRSDLRRIIPKTGGKRPDAREENYFSDILSTSQVRYDIPFLPIVSRLEYFPFTHRRILFSGRAQEDPAEGKIALSRVVC